MCLLRIDNYSWEYKFKCLYRKNVYWYLLFKSIYYQKLWNKVFAILDQCYSLSVLTVLFAIRHQWLFMLAKLLVVIQLMLRNKVFGILDQYYTLSMLFTIQYQWSVSCHSCHYVSFILKFYACYHVIFPVAANTVHVHACFENFTIHLPLTFFVWMLNFRTPFILSKDFFIFTGVCF